VQYDAATSLILEEAYLAQAFEVKFVSSHSRGGSYTVRNLQDNDGGRWQTKDSSGYKRAVQRRKRSLEERIIDAVNAAGGDLFLQQDATMATSINRTVLDQLRGCIGDDTCGATHRHEAMLGCLALSDNELDLALDLYFDTNKRQSCIIAGVLVAAESDDSAVSLPEGWQAQVSTASREEYFVNMLTGESTWTRPTEEAHLPLLPAGWYTAVSSSTGMLYYVNELSGWSTYNLPVVSAEAELREAGWDTAVSRATGWRYFLNRKTGESTYDLPPLPEGLPEGPISGDDEPCPLTATAESSDYEMQRQASTTTYINGIAAVKNYVQSPCQLWTNSWA